MTTATSSREQSAGVARFHPGPRRPREVQLGHLGAVEEPTEDAHKRATPPPLAGEGWRMAGLWLMASSRNLG